MSRLGRSGFAVNRSGARRRGAPLAAVFAGQPSFPLRPHHKHAGEDGRVRGFSRCEAWRAGPETSTGSESSVLRPLGCGRFRLAVIRARSHIDGTTVLSWKAVLKRRTHSNCEPDRVSPATPI